MMLGKDVYGMIVVMAVTDESRQFHLGHREWLHVPQAPSVCDKAVNM
jgi:hypothetical protein